MQYPRIMTYMMLLAKIAITGLALWVAFSGVDFSETLQHLYTADIAILLAAEALILCTFLIAALRMAQILGMFGIWISIANSFRITLIGNFFSQFLVTFLSGDVARVWYLRGSGRNTVHAASAILLDRSLGVIAIIGLMLAALPYLYPLTTHDAMKIGLLTIAALGTGGILVFLLLGVIDPARVRRRAIFEILANLASVSRFIWREPKQFAGAMVLSFTLQIGNILAIYLLFMGFDGSANLWECFFIVPIATLISMLPISAAGWGVREGAMVAGFGLFGHPPSIVLAVSITFGLLVLLASLPGAGCWLLRPVANESTNQ